MMRPHDEGGFTLVELLVAATMSLVLLGATFTVFEAMIRQSTLAEQQSEVETRVRQGSDRLARQLRNLASPGDIITNIAASTQPKSVDRDLPVDLIFKDVADTRPAGSLNSANVRRVRYCLQTSGTVPGAGYAASPSLGVLWMQFQTWASATVPDLPADTACPGAGWTTQRVVADHLVNGATTPVFRYTGDAGPISGTTAAERERITRVESILQVDADASRAPAAAQLTTAVILRNQNRAPVAGFTFTLANPVTCSVVLNGSASEDPESKPLDYGWYIDGLVQIESGVVVQKTVSKGTHTFQLNVYDRAHLVGTSPAETHTC
jgi:type II secretory pathway pseudopilin PulG